ncbi:F0F1 ATP synthase subunit gamma [Candidatus Daviesbacteria bacterium]|nr:F0F1 ATP synthase subunit gamma [Candidatus Daviesbacteria bacterium]
MLTLRQVHQALEESESLKIIAQAYTELAALKLQKIRFGIEQNRTFFQEVKGVLRAVKVAAEKRGIAQTSKKKGMISLVLTSNHHFYGNLENQLLDYFVENSTKFPTDRIVVGSTGTEFLKQTKYSYPYKSLVFKDDLPFTQDMHDLVSELAQYEQILVYYSRMRSVLIQEPHVVDLLQQPPEQYLNAPERSLDYIFEPEIESMLDFFNNQITTLLLEQTFLESELARTAARIVSMDQAQGNADDYIKSQRKQLSQAKRATDNNQLLDTISRMINWRRGNNAQQ